MQIVDHKFDSEASDTLKFQFKPSPNINLNVQAQKRTLIIHTTEGPSVEAAMATFLRKKVPGDDRSGLSIHLIVGRNGKDVVQMVPLERGATHAADFNSKSIGIEVDYPGDLREKGEEFRLRSQFNEAQYIKASALNDSKFRYWPLFPKEQLDALVEISKALIEKYPIVDVAGHEELHSYKLDPGPAFPIVQFRARLGIQTRAIIPQETIRRTRVRNQPGDGAALLPEPEIPAGTAVTIINQANDEQGKQYCLISVLDTVEGNPWILGWVERDAVMVRSNQEFIVREDHYLGTPDGGRVQVIQPHPNGYDANPRHFITPHKYILIHYTTGSRVESTIAHFRNANSGVSAHLLIARDGRVIQFVPFNRVAYHAGYSWWERDVSLNQYSIGIELDNAGNLTGSPGNWLQRNGKVPVPDDEVELKKYWRDLSNLSKPWHKFTPIQLDVLEKIIKTLVDHYGGPEELEILGHDDVNLANRVDPGPLFPMEDMRERVFGRRLPRIKEYRLAKDAKMYSNEGNPPDLQRLKSAFPLPLRAEVIVLREREKWCYVSVVRSKAGKGSRGWLLSQTLTPVATMGERAARRGKNKRGKIGGRQGGGGAVQSSPKRMVTTIPQTFYPGFGDPPSFLMDLPMFEEDQRIRIEEVRGNWTLVVLLDYFGKEGWVETKCISPDPMVA